MATSARIDELRKKFDENPRRYFAPLANEYRKAGDPEQAIFICEEYLPQQPGHMSGHIVYGQALFELGRVEEARTVFETALSLDPENLIALRHLGDIARQAGDAHTARIWYQRVLEADPRNEEIAQLMMSLLSTPASSSIVDHNAPTPLSSPIVPSPVETRASPTPAIAGEPMVDTQTTPTDEVTTPRGTHPSLTPVAPPAISPQDFVSRHAPTEEELLDLDSFDLGGVPLSSLRNAKATEPEPDAEIAPPPLEGVGSVDEDDHAIAIGDDAFVETDYPSFEAAAPPRMSVPFTATPDEHEPVEIEKAQEFTADSFEQDPYAIASKPFTESDATTPFTETPPGTIELAADIDLGLPDDGGSSSTFALGDDSVDGLESFEEGVIAGHSPTETDISTESFFSIPDDAAAADVFVVDAAAFTSEGATPVESHVDAVDVGETAEPIHDGDVAHESPLEQESADEAPMVHPTDAALDVMVVDSSESEAAPSLLRTPQFEQSVDSQTPPPPPPLGTPRFNAAQAPSTQSDPFMTPAFGAVEPIAEAAFAPEAETEFAHDGSTEASNVETEFGAENVDAFATSDTAEGSAHVPEDVGEGGGAFVTETMAALYLEQGHFDAAIDIFRQLVQQRPDDIALRDRLHAAEERAWGHQRDLGESILSDDSEAAADFEGESAPAPHTYGGPTIRDFLTGIFYPPPPIVEEVPAPIEVDEQSSSEPDASSMRGNAPAADSVSASLGALFSEADAAAPSTEPAEEPTLGGRVATPTTGTPAHRASSELSLDHVFKANSGRPNEGFSFDQFFSEEAAESPPPAPETSIEPRSDSSDDIAQFNAWLNGLKKS